ncbi:MAG: phosphatase PAP2 family protein [Candidatus Binataceae bacterium]
MPLSLVLLFVPIGALAVLGCGCAVLAGYSVPRSAEATMLASFSLMWALACNFFLFQPGFGRIDISIFLANPNLYGFKPFHGHSGTGFPSGHTAIAASFLLVFWVFYPRARILIAGVIGAVMIALVLATSHFVSDVVGGLFLGATAAEMTIALFRAVRYDQP